MKRNPILPLDVYIPDGEAHVFDGELYLYGSLDKVKEHFCSTEYRVAHTKDLCQWKVEDVSFRTSDVSWEGQSKIHSSVDDVKSFSDLPAHIREKLPPGSENYPIEQIVAAVKHFSQAGLPQERLLYAPDCIKKNGKYYLYMCLSDDTEGVAVSESPTGPFKEAQKLPVSSIDPAVFVDDDGQGYYYWGQFSGNAAKLSDDMTAILEDTVVEGLVTEKEHNFHEGSSMRRRGDTYYYVFADTSRGKPTSLGYATSKSPLGPFVYRGVIIDNSECDPKSWNIHGSIEEFKGQWYVFYHRSSQNSDKMRRACMEPIFFDENGLISEVKMTSQGAGEPFAIGEEIPAYTACGVKGGAYIDKYEDTEALYFSGKSSAVFRYVTCPSGTWQVRFDCRGNGTVRVYADGVKVGEGTLPSCEIELKSEKPLREIEIELACDSVVTISSFTIG